MLAPLNVRCRCLLGGSLVWLAAGAPAFGERLVTVRATADSNYVERRAAAGTQRMQTYVFAKGQFFKGAVYDATLYKMPFQKIAETLAFDLWKQNYAPTKDLKTADLIIVVHWGVTMGNDRGAGMMSFDLDTLREAAGGIDFVRQAAEESGELDIGVLAEAQALFRATSNQAAMELGGDDVRASSNAELLGMAGALNAESGALFDSEESRTLRSMIEEERYFIILVAYDAYRFREGQKKKLWTARLSIRSAGVNFKIALDRMSNAGGKYYGTKQQGLAMEFLKERTGTVTVGELKVIESGK